MHDASAGAAAPEGHELIPGAHVWEKAAEPLSTLPTPQGVVLDFRLGVVLARWRSELLLVTVVIVEEEFGIRNHRHRHGQVVIVHQSGGSIAAHVGDLVPAIVRQHEQAVLLPLKRLLLAVCAPNGTDALAISHVDRLVETESGGW